LIGRGAVAPSQTLPKGPPPPATTGTDGGTAAKNQKTASRKELERTATTGKDSDNRTKKASGEKSEGNPLQLSALKPPQRRQSARKDEEAPPS